MIFGKNKTQARRPARRIVPRKTLNARAASSTAEVEDYENESEPSMKLYQAFIVVLILHIVAVAGIYGFNQLKEKQPVATETKKEASAPLVTEKAKAPEAKAALEKPVKTETAMQNYTVVAGDTLKKIALKFNTSIEAVEKANNLSATSVIKVGQVLSIPGSGKNSAKASEKTTPALTAKAPDTAPKNDAKTAEKPKEASDKSYVVVKGDNPYTIAKKFNTTQAALLKANNIDDPRKLQIGQKILIP